MSETLKHSRVRTVIPMDEDSALIETYSYNDNLSGFQQEQMNHMRTSKMTFIADMVKACDPISDKKTKKIHLLIETDDFHHPRMITRWYPTVVEKYDRR